MRVGFIGDIVGRVGRKVVINNLKTLKREFNIDFVVANGENASGGFGLSAKNALDLFECGIDAITGGNHSFDKKDIVALMDEFAIIRPYNHFPGTPGRGVVNLLKDDMSLSVINLMGHYGLPHTNNAFLEVENALKECESKNILIDFHAEATSEKNAFFWHLAGRVSAVFGTHTHVGTDDLQICKNTAYVSDVGLSGAFDGVIGMDKQAPIKSFLTGLKHSFNVNENARSIMQMIIFDCEDGICTDAFKIRLIQGDDEMRIQKAIIFKD
ncbi:MAG: TIGR00282 family metallophosphoesterase [Campylobacter sp.]